MFKAFLHTHSHPNSLELVEKEFTHLAQGVEGIKVHKI